MIHPQIREGIKAVHQQSVTKPVETMTLQEKLGQMFVTGFPADSVNDSFRRLVQEKKLGNVILFKENLTSREQLLSLSRELHGLIRQETGYPPFMTIDEEGGIVSRIPETMEKMPSAMALSALQEPEKVYQAALLSGRQLRALGLNFNLAPVLDVNSNPSNPVIGIRSYGRDAEQTWHYASRAVKGYMDAGVMCSGKHFPGHGDTMADSHLELPVNHKTLEELRQTEIEPFARAARAGLPAVTIAHVVYDQLDDVPATMSRKIVTGILRQELGFDGLIISDCMEMNAISRTYGIEEGVVRAVEAGIELIFVSHLHDKVRSSMEALEKAVESGRLSMATIDSAVNRILRFKQQYANVEPHEDEEAFRASRNLAVELFRETVRAEGIFHLGERPLFVSPAQTQVSKVSNAEGTLCFAEEMQKHFGGQAVRLALRPDEEQIRHVLALAEKASAVVVGTINATVYAGQMELLLALQKTGLPMACVTLRNPFELERLNAQVFGLKAWEYSPRAVERAGEFFTR